MNILKVLTPRRLIGNLGEREAARLLRKKGYRILKKNYEALGGEIDIIARKRGVTAFVEVKARNVKYLGYKEARPGSSVTPEKQRKIIRTASYYNAHYPSDTRFRFDVIEVYLEDGKRRPKVREIKHIESAFDKNSAFDSKYHYKRKKEGSVL
nr:YraN family protein [Oscillospiraceae bacterium]